MRILLLGDVSDLHYHVGDEASYNEVYRRLHSENIELEVRSFDIEYPGLRISENWRGLLTQESVIKNLILPSLRTWDILWLVGNGNLNSLFPEFLWHRLAIGSLAKSSGLLLIATSQGIGPFWCQEHSNAFRDLSKQLDYLSLRDPLASEYCKMMEIPHRICIDDAFYLPSPHEQLIDNSLGLSLRDWDEPEITSAVVSLTERRLNWSVHQIPHLIDPKNSCDVGHMSRHFRGRTYNFDYFSKAGSRFDLEVKRLTGQMQLVVASRYHAAIFAIERGRPCIGLFANEYYKSKMLGLAAFGFPRFKAIDARNPFEWEDILQFPEPIETSTPSSAESTEQILAQITR